MTLPAPGTRPELVCLKHGFDMIRGRVPPHGPRILVRTGRSKILPVPGEIFTVEVERSWVFGHTPYVKGLITDSRFDLPRLSLKPLRLDSHDLWNPAEEAWLDEADSLPVYDEIRAAGPRPQYELQDVLPEDAVELHWEEDPILEAVELVAAGARFEAADLLGDLLSVDLRCLDAHAHLGIFELNSRWPGAVERAERHYRVGVGIGEMALPSPVLDFGGLLPGGFLGNRPFLRCLQGLGLCRWRQGDLETARRVFRRLLWLSPDDGLGARINLAAVERGRSWEEARQGGAV